MRNLSIWESIGKPILLVAISLTVSVLIIANSENRFNSDFLKFYLSSRFLLKHESIYSPLTLDTIPAEIEIEPELFDQPVLANLNSPLLAVLMSPLARISYPYAYIIWSLLAMILGLVSIYVIIDTLNQQENYLNYFDFAIIFLLFFPTLISILSGQISTLLLFLLVVAWKASRQSKDNLAGIALGIALSLKIFTGLFIPVFLIQRRWKLLGWYLGTFFILNLASVFIVGYEQHLEYLETLSSVSWYSATWNTSFMGFFTRIFGGSDSPPLIPSPNTGYFFTIFLSIVVVMVILWLVKNASFENSDDFDLVYSITIVGMLLVSPLGWIYYYVLLILPLTVAWSIAVGQGFMRVRVLIIFSWILCTIPFVLIQGDEIRLVDILIWSNLPFIGLLLFMIILSQISLQSIGLTREPMNI